MPTRGLHPSPIPLHLAGRRPRKQAGRSPLRLTPEEALSLAENLIRRAAPSITGEQAVRLSVLLLVICQSGDNPEPAPELDTSERTVVIRRPAVPPPSEAGRAFVYRTAGPTTATDLPIAS